MDIVVIESPYAGDVENNVEYARKAMLHSLELGEAPYASHLLYTQVWDDLDPEQRKAGIKAGVEFHRVADKVAFYCDRGISGGMRFAFENRLDVKSSLSSFDIELRLIEDLDNQIIDNLIDEYDLLNRYYFISNGGEKFCIRNGKEKSLHVLIEGFAKYGYF